MTDENNQLILIDEAKNLPVPMARNESEGLNGKRANEADHKVLRNVVKVAVARAFLTLGKQVSKNDATFIVDGLHAEILRSFPGIRLEEILLAVHKLSMGEFISIDKIYTLSLSVFVSGIRSYMNSEERANAAKLYSRSVLQLEQTLKPSPEEFEKMRKQNTLNAYEFYKKNSFYNDYGNAILNHLYEVGLVNFTDEQAIELLKAARKKVFAYYTSPSRSIDERNEKRRIVEELKVNREHPLFQTEAKKLALNMLFKEMVALEVDLSDMLN
jgi:hypothetical protein